MVQIHPDLTSVMLQGCDDYWAWNKKDKSHEVKLVGTRQQTAHFHPKWSNGTAGVRGTRCLNYGIHYWEVRLSQRLFGTSMMLGVGTKRARLHVDAFVNLVGEDEQSWGISHKGVAWHSGKSRTFTKPFRENEATTVGLLFDWNKGTLSYFKDGEYLGVAFTGLNHVDQELFPIVCSTAAKTEMTLGRRRRTYHSLQDRCRAAIVSKIREEKQIDTLPLPVRIRSFLKDTLR
ncbi:hypothetical protein ACF0H5_003963 [Mactra antiquata]